MKPTSAFILGLAVAISLSSATIAATAPASLKGHALAGKARIGLDEARDIALKARPGSITDQELEKEGGGSGLRYSFDITSAGKTYEVGVDARTGKVLENGHESAGAEAAEAASERHSPH
jgi:uncharacterized membrane protein YkoI